MDHISKDKLFIAIRECNIDDVKQVISFLTDINVKNSFGETPLFFAVDLYHNFKCKSDEESDLIIDILLNAGSNPNMKNNKNELPLHIACSYAAIKVVKLLIQYDALVDIRDGQGNTPLLFASRGNDDVNIAIVDILLMSGADINAVNDDGDNALMYPSSWGMDKMISFLVSKGIDVQKHDNSGNTALIWAVKSGSINTAKILLNAKADPHLKNIEGLSAIDYASRSGDNKMIGLLKGQ